MLVVADCSAYNLFKSLLQVTDENQIIGYMKVYYAQIIALVNKAYEDSFKNDADLRISVQLKNYLFLTVIFLNIV